MVRVTDDGDDLRRLRLVMADLGPAVQCRRRATVCVLSYSLPLGEPGSAHFANGPAPGHRCTGQRGKCGCAHAEQRAVAWALRSGSLRRDLPVRVLSWLGPCTGCANLLLVSGLLVASFSYVDELEHDQMGKRILRGSGVDVRRLPVGVPWRTP